MLLNNLDPEVAERPEELVVYGGSGPGRAQPRGAARDRAHAASARRRRDAARPERQAGRRVPRRTPGAPRVLIANSLLVPRWATWDEFRRLEADGLTMFGQMTAGQLDLHRHAGDPPGHVPDVRRRGRAALRLARPRRPDDPDRRARRDGRRAAARRDDGRRGDPLRRGRSRRGSSGGSRRATSTRRRSRSTTRSRACRAAARDGRPLSVGLLGNAAEVVPELARRGEHFDLVTDQTAAHDPLTGYVPAGLVGRRRRPRLRASDPDEYLRRARASRSPSHVAGCSSTSGRAAMFSIMATTCEGRRMKQA